MRKTVFTKEQISQALIAFKSGKKAKEIARDLSVTVSTIYTWKRKYSEKSSTDIEFQKLQELKEENTHLKNLYIDMSINYKTLKDRVGNSSNL